jgi:phosphoribosylanthranilate isomerase
MGDFLYLSRFYQTVYMTKVKFCGFLRYDDIVDAICLGVDYIGVNLISRSPRYVAPEIALEWNLQLIQDGLRSKIQLVAIIDTDTILNFFDIYQVYGDVTLTHSDIRLWKHISSPVDVVSQSQTLYERIVFDLSKNINFTSGIPSDNHLSNYQLLAKKGYKVVLAGGLDHKNIVSICNQLHPDIVDVASGIESSPGIKDYQKMEQFLHQIKLTL